MNGRDFDALAQLAEANGISIAVANAVFDLAEARGLGDDEAERILKSPTEQDARELQPLLRQRIAEFTRA
jgi:hypothetical protein